MPKAPRAKQRKAPTRSRTKKSQAKASRSKTPPPRYIALKKIIRYAVCLLTCLGLYWMLAYYPQRHQQAILSELLSYVPDFYQNVYGEALSEPLKQQLKHVRYSTSAKQRYDDYFGSDNTALSNDNLPQSQYVASVDLRQLKPSAMDQVTVKDPPDVDLDYPGLLNRYQKNLPTRTIRAKFNTLSQSAFQHYTPSTPKSIVLAILGCESGWGNLVGYYPMNFDIISALGTLASSVEDPKKSIYYLNNLLAYLHMLMKHLPPPLIHHTLIQQSTFDGGMGIPQLEPINYAKYATDGDGNDLANIWQSMPDAAASVDNYLQQHGWQDGLRWGYFANIKALNPALIKLIKAKQYQSIEAWQKLGITLANTPIPLPKAIAQSQARLLIPNIKKHTGVAFLVTHNYHVLMQWNPSESEALMIGIISDIMENSSLDYSSFR